jgi:hypothetical protein
VLADVAAHGEVTREILHRETWICRRFSTWYDYPENQLLEFLAKKFHDDIANQCSYHRYRKIRHSKDVPDGPCRSIYPTRTRALKFSHQEIRIEQKDDEAGLD